MAYFHSKWTRSRGGLKGRLMRRVAGETLEEMQSLHRAYPDHTTINWPPRGQKALKSRSLPMLWVDADRTDILEGVESSEVPDSYILVLTWLLRREFWLKYGAGEIDGDSFLTVNIRGALIQLLRAGDWIDQPSSLGLENLQYKLEKIDLGRRSDLNFSSRQSPIQKYDQDYKHDQHEPAPVLDVTREDGGNPETAEVDFDKMYRDGSREVRMDLWETRPWMRSSWSEKYGEP